MPSLMMHFTAAGAAWASTDFPSTKLANINRCPLRLPRRIGGRPLRQLYDKDGNSTGAPIDFWYANGGSSAPESWQYITIPLQNLTASSASATITGVSISTQNACVAYVYELQFTDIPSAHALWVQPADFTPPPFNPFATSIPSPTSAVPACLHARGVLALVLLLRDIEAARERHGGGPDARRQYRLGERLSRRQRLERL